MSEATKIEQSAKEKRELLARLLKERASKEIKSGPGSRGLTWAGVTIIQQF